MRAPIHIRENNKWKAGESHVEKVYSTSISMYRIDWNHRVLQNRFTRRSHGSIRETVERSAIR
ncbi:hypothetical protein STFR1_50273 [Bacillus vallismortis]